MQLTSASQEALRSQGDVCSISRDSNSVDTKKGVGLSLLALGGGTGAVAASAHAGCARFRGTDPMVTKQPRKKIAEAVGAQTISAGIPAARWVRAKIFESLIRNDAFASEIATKSIGFLDLPRPEAVVIVDASEDLAKTRDALKDAVKLAFEQHSATLIHAPAVPYPGFTAEEATPVLPDFVVVSREIDDEGAVLIVGDAKDYERVRARIDDQRFLKGFLQVAFGAEAFDRWEDLPPDLRIAETGVLAVPRNAFLQPTVIPELLKDHQQEIRFRLEERVDEANVLEWTGDAKSFVEHLVATFDPFTCSTCPLYGYCRDELRASDEPIDFLAEMGVPANQRGALLPLIAEGKEVPANVPRSLVARVRATTNGVAIRTGKRRTDPVGLDGTVNVVIIKSDSGALSVYGMGIQQSPESDWAFTTFEQPNADQTRRVVMELIGAALDENLIGDDEDGKPGRPVHIVVPDGATSDLLASIADSLAGAELARLRWARDIEMGRTPLSFDGNPATLPEPLNARQRLAVSFLLEEDRARAFQMRSAVVNIGEALGGLIIAGGPAEESNFLNYLVPWAESIDGPPVNSRALVDARKSGLHTPGAKLSEKLSNELFESLTDTAGKQSLPRYRELVTEALDYRAEVFNRAVGALNGFRSSKMRDVLRSLEADAQQIWQRRRLLQSNDLVRFGSTPEFWRNALVEIVEADAKAATQFRLLTDSTYAEEVARDASVRHLAVATVISVSPIVVEVESRRIGLNSKAVALQVNDTALVESDDVILRVQAGSVSITGLPAGILEAGPSADSPRRFTWAPTHADKLVVGDTLVLADFEWFCDLKRFNSLNVERPALDKTLAPKADCDSNSYEYDPENHGYCCKPHAVREAENADYWAERRSAGEMNPQVWPPIRDLDSFDVTAHGEVVAEEVEITDAQAPEFASIDELD